MLSSFYRKRLIAFQRNPRPYNLLFSCLHEVLQTSLKRDLRSCKDGALYSREYYYKMGCNLMELKLFIVLNHYQKIGPQNAHTKRISVRHALNEL